MQSRGWAYFSFWWIVCKRIWQCFVHHLRCSLRVQNQIIWTILRDLKCLQTALPPKASHSPTIAVHTKMYARSERKLRVIDMLHEISLQRDYFLFTVTAQYKPLLLFFSSPTPTRTNWWPICVKQLHSEQALQEWLIHRGSHQLTTVQQGKTCLEFGILS